MVSFLLMMLVMIAVLWALYRFMYPKPPEYFFAKEGDDTSIRQCAYCQHCLETYRGILTDEYGNEVPQHNEVMAKTQKISTEEEQSALHFFCNAEHQEAFFTKQHKDLG